MKELRRLTSDPLALRDLASAGAMLDPVLAFSLVALAVDPSATYGHRFTIAHAPLAGGPPDAWLRIQNGGPPAVLRAQPRRDARGHDPLHPRRPAAHARRHRRAAWARPSRSTAIPRPSRSCAAGSPAPSSPPAESPPRAAPLCGAARRRVAAAARAYDRTALTFWSSVNETAALISLFARQSASLLRAGS